MAARPGGRRVDRHNARPVSSFRDRHRPDDGAWGRPGPRHSSCCGTPSSFALLDNQHKRFPPPQNAAAIRGGAVQETDRAPSLEFVSTASTTGRRSRKRTPGPALFERELPGVSLSLCDPSSSASSRHCAHSAQNNSSMLPVHVPWARAPTDPDCLPMPDRPQTTGRPRPAVQRCHRCHVSTAARTGSAGGESHRNQDPLKKRWDLAPSRWLPIGPMVHGAVG
jgi:hypothetical protein